MLLPIAKKASVKREMIRENCVFLMTIFNHGVEAELRIFCDTNMNDYDKNQMKKKNFKDCFCQ